MSAHALRLGHRPSPGTRLRVAACALRARSHAASLDRQLAAGVPTWRTPLHAARAVQLTAVGKRRGLAETLTRLELRSLLALRADSVLSLLVPPCRESVHECASQIEDLVILLRSQEPIAAAGVAQLRLLLCDGSGPLYLPGHAGELCRCLHRIRRVMTIRE